MSEPFRVIPPSETASEEIEPPKGNNKGGSDNSGFGLINWLFDHINERKPIFLCLYQEYEKEVKLSSSHKIINCLLLVVASTADILLFTVYALSVMLIILGITYIFVKGTGIIELIGR